MAEAILTVINQSVIKIKLCYRLDMIFTMTFESRKVIATGL